MWQLSLFRLLGARSDAFPLVRLGIELREEPQEHDHEPAGDGGLRNGEAAVVLEEEDAAVSDDGGELDHLHLGEVPLPPEVGLHVGAEGGEGVVRVHHDVDEGVEQRAKGFVAARLESVRMYVILIYRRITDG